MANFPSFRVGVAAPFMDAGVGWLGSLVEKSGRQEGRVGVVVFVCMRGRAVFLDCATSIDGSSDGRWRRWLQEDIPFLRFLRFLRFLGSRRLGFLRFLGFLPFLRSNANGQRLGRDIGEVVHLRRDGERDGGLVEREVEVVKDSE